jgi:hypothetical protein
MDLIRDNLPHMKTSLFHSLPGSGAGSPTGKNESHNHASLQWLPTIETKLPITRSPDKLPLTNRRGLKRRRFNLSKRTSVEARLELLRARSQRIEDQFRLIHAKSDEPIDSNGVYY